MGLNQQSFDITWDSHVMTCHDMRSKEAIAETWLVVKWGLLCRYICKLFLIFKPPLENGVSIWSSCRGKVLVEGGRGRTVASPVDCQRRWGLLPWKQGLTGSSILHTSPTWTQQTISIWRSQLTSLEEFLWEPTWQWEQHGSRWKAKLLAGEAGHPRCQRKSPSARLKKCHHRWR